jgi:large subunit ribosomal protein L31
MLEINGLDCHPDTLKCNVITIENTQSPGGTMKADIHPAYRTVLFHDTAADVFFLIGSTVDTDRTQVHGDGNTYPYVALDVSSASHPMYTGQQRKTTTEGRIAGFNKRFATFGSGGAKNDSPAAE